MRPVVSLIITAAVFSVYFVPTSQCVPFVVIPGLGDTCSSISRTVKGLETLSGSKGYCVCVGDSELDSYFTPLIKQTTIICEKIKRMDQLRHGYNIVGFSQGALVARGVIEFCDDAPRVKHFVSFGGPHAGISSAPSGSFKFLSFFDERDIYTEHVQETFAPSGYVKMPTRMDEYLRGCKFLPILNNEIPHKRNSTYKERFSSIERLVLVKFFDDEVLKPVDSSWFGFYIDGVSNPVRGPEKTQLYIEDWIGLRTLREANKVKFVLYPGEHHELHLVKENFILLKDIIPFLASGVVDLPGPFLFLTH